MDEEGSVESPDVVGILGETDPARRAQDALVERDVVTVRGPPSLVIAAEPDVLVAIGPPAVHTVADEPNPPPVLCIDGPAGVPGAAPTALEETVATLALGECEAVRLPRLAVDGLAATADREPPGHERAAEHRGDQFNEYRDESDVTGEEPQRESDADAARFALHRVGVTRREPGRIGAFEVHVDGAPLDRVRADGILVATPAGTRGYAGRVGAPRLDGAIEGLVVVPIAPFRRRRDRWVTGTDEVEVTVLREEGPVEIRADDRLVGTLPGRGQFRVTVGDPLVALRPTGPTQTPTGMHRPAGNG